MKSIGRLYIITDRVVQTRYSHAELAELAIEGGADSIQYRSKSSDIRELIREALEVANICRRRDVTFIVNDRVDLCLAVDADGVHLGREDMPVDIARKILGPEKIIGATIRNREHLRQAESEGASYAGLGPIFGTTSKMVAAAPLGVEMIRHVCADAKIPIIGIAGIISENIPVIIGAGAYGVAVIGAVCAASDVCQAARLLRYAIDESVGRRIASSEDGLAAR